MGILYVVATPIGNLRDLSERARDVLGEATLVVAEDTRRTGMLLHRLGFDRPMMSYHHFNERSKVDRILEALGSGPVALVSDSGTPGISDPGAILVRAAAEAGHQVVPVPGPSAFTAALSAAGMTPGPFIFLGFLPRNAAERLRELQRAMVTGYALVLYEAPSRVGALLSELAGLMPGREAAVFREISKMHEEAVRGGLAELAERFSQARARGEFVVVVGPGDSQGGGGDPDDLLLQLLESGAKPSAAAADVARLTGEPKGELYRRAVAIRHARSGARDQGGSAGLERQLSVVEEDALQDSQADQERPK